MVTQYQLLILKCSPPPDTCPHGPPKAMFFQMARPAVHIYSYISMIYYLHSSMLQHSSHKSRPLVSSTRYHTGIVLTGPSKRETAITLDLLIRHAPIRIGNKSNQNSKDFNLSEISRTPLVWGMQRYSLRLSMVVYVLKYIINLNIHKYFIMFKLWNTKRLNTLQGTLSSILGK